MKLPAPRQLDGSIDRSSHLDSALGRGMDVAIMTLLFLGVGYLLDRWLGTKPVFMIVLVLLALIGEFVRMRYVYEAQMQALEAERAAAAHAKSGAQG